MTVLPTVLLRPGEADRVVAGHPWLYGGSVLRLTQPVTDGELVQVKDHRQRFLGVGFYNAKSKIHVRMLSSERVEPDQAFFEKRLRDALSVRQRHLPRATSFRIVNAEADLLSGLIVDCYEDVLVMQISSLGMERRKATIISALGAVLKPRAILERNDLASRKFEGLPESTGILAGECPPEIETRLNGLRFAASPLTGHKTGLYLDQQVNYQRVADFIPLLPDARVLDGFSFLGGFGLHAARAGATQVLLLDQSQDAIDCARRNAALNGLEDRCSFEAVNVFDWLKAQTSVPTNEKIIPRFDLIVLDPPSFTRTRASVPDALRGYKEIHLRALKLLKPSGILATFCCSHHISGELFEEIIGAAAYDARRRLRRIATFSQSPDHPILPAVPETEYLKGYAFELVAG